MSTRKPKPAAAAKSTFLKGRGFVAMVRLSTKGNETRALAGETCERVPDADLVHLLAHDPPQVIAAETWAAVKKPGRAWLLDRTAKNLPWRGVQQLRADAATAPADDDQVQKVTKANALAFLTDLEPQVEWLIKAGLLPAAAAKAEV